MSRRQRLHSFPGQGTRRQRLVCAIGGHIPRWLHGRPGAEYACARCGRRIYFWHGRHTGWHLEPEPVWNARWLERRR